MCPSSPSNSDITFNYFHNPTLLINSYHCYLQLGCNKKIVCPFSIIFLKIGTDGGIYHFYFRNFKSDFTIWPSHHSSFIVQKETGRPWLVTQPILRQLGRCLSLCTDYTVKLSKTVCLNLGDPREPRNLTAFVNIRISEVTKILQSPVHFSDTFRWKRTTTKTSKIHFCKQEENFLLKRTKKIARVVFPFCLLFTHDETSKHYYGFSNLHVSPQIQKENYEHQKVFGFSQLLYIFFGTSTID